MAAKKSKLLVVEDDSIMGIELKEVLEAFGYQVLDIVSSGEEAVKAAQKYSPDLVLMDIRLKGNINGIEATRKIREFSDVPVTFLTGYKSDGIVQEVAAIPGTVMLTKPVDFDRLKNSLKKTLS
jgi:CheY-like chemotaxis protein